MIKSFLLAATGALALTGCGSSGTTTDPTKAAEDGMPSEAPSPIAGEAAPAAPAVPSQPKTSPDPGSVLPAAAPTATPPPAPPIPPPLPAAPLSARDEKGEKGARAVIRTWAHGLETRQFGVAWEQFGSPPASRSAFTRWWGRYRTIKVTMGAGESDAGMGSLYYTVPVVVTGTTQTNAPFRLAGDVVVRRVNDVDGASPAQLRWHIGSADLKDAPPPR